MVSPDLQAGNRFRWLQKLSHENRSVIGEIDSILCLLLIAGLKHNLLKKRLFLKFLLRWEIHGLFNRSKRV